MLCGDLCKHCPDQSVSFTPSQPASLNLSQRTSTDWKHFSRLTLLRLQCLGWESVGSCEHWSGRMNQLRAIMINLCQPYGAEITCLCEEQGATVLRQLSSNLTALEPALSDQFCRCFLTEQTEGGGRLTAPSPPACNRFLFLISYFTFLISHFSLLISYFSFLISYFSFLISDF